MRTEGILKMRQTHSSYQFLQMAEIVIHGFCGSRRWFRYIGNGYTTTAEFIPSTPDDWCYAGVLTGCIDLDLTAYDGQGNIRLKIENVNDYGNNMYVDNVQLSSNCFIQPGAPTAQFSYSASSGCPPITVVYR